MLRNSVYALFVVTMFVGIVLAEEAKGKFKKWDKDPEIFGDVLVVTVDGKDMAFPFNIEAKLFDGDQEIKGKDRPNFLKGLKAEDDLTITYDKNGKRINLKEIRRKK